MSGKDLPSFIKTMNDGQKTLFSCTEIMKEEQKQCIFWRTIILKKNWSICGQERYSLICHRMNLWRKRLKYKEEFDCGLQ